MTSRLVIEGNAVYEIDEECEAEQKKRKNGGMRPQECGCQKKKEIDKKKRL